MKEHPLINKTYLDLFVFILISVKNMRKCSKVPKLTVRPTAGQPIQKLI